MANLYLQALQLTPLLNLIGRELAEDAGGKIKIINIYLLFLDFEWAATRPVACAGSAEVEFKRRAWSRFTVEGRLKKSRGTSALAYMEN